MSELKGNTCPCCGGLQTRPLSGREIAMNIVCVAMALVMVYFVCRVADHWLTFELDKVTEHLLLREPLAEWD